MMLMLTVTLSLLSDDGVPLPIATFDTADECGAVLPNLIYDANCTGEAEIVSSPRPRPRPTQPERTE